MHIRMLAVLVAVVATVLALSVSPAAADGDGATIAKDFGCFVFVAPIAALTTDQSIDVASASGNTTLVCHFTAADFVGPLPTETVKLTDITCSTFEGIGTGSGVFNKTGNGVFKCEIKANA
jgi:hypothetical protein